jgi:predicted acetyltransferase
VVLPRSEGVVTVRPFVASDRDLIVRERDEECERWLGPGSADPSPTACIVVNGTVVGWIDADLTPAWLQLGEANVGYSVFPAHRGNGYAARALRLLAGELEEWGLRRALLVIDLQNRPSLAVARAVGADLLAQRAMGQFPTSAVYALELSRQARR